jgi:FdhD protein
MDERLYSDFSVKEIICDDNAAEIITKVIRLGAPGLVSRSTPTAAAVNLARKYNVTLLGYVRKNSEYVYSGEERLA